mmetsp:Transcript_37134/g.58462  ORF Transcript_37134/g.58462 Transcript_37134/m.58462 type:complete len:260 (-) Transcript_37134:118-897(-)
MICIRDPLFKNALLTLFGCKTVAKFLQQFTERERRIFSEVGRLGVWKKDVKKESELGKLGRGRGRVKKTRKEVGDFFSKREGSSFLFQSERCFFFEHYVFPLSLSFSFHSFNRRLHLLHLLLLFPLFLLLSRQSLRHIRLSYNLFDHFSFEPLIFFFSLFQDLFSLVLPPLGNISKKRLFLHFFTQNGVNLRKRLENRVKKPLVDLLIPLLFLFFPLLFFFLGEGDFFRGLEKVTSFFQIIAINSAGREKEAKFIGRKA